MFILFDIIYILIFSFYAFRMMLQGKWHEGMKFRLGNIPDFFRRALSDKPKIWIHAVSVGEVLAVAGFIKRLSREYPSSQIICSTVTQTGFELASANLKGAALVIYAPVDFSWVVKKFVSVIGPRIYISAETELWPNLYRCLSRRNIPIALINGRISDQSLKNYAMGKFLLQPALSSVSMFAMQTEEDARRIISLGADASRVKVSGNLKFDAVDFTDPDHAYDAWKNHRIFLAGSTHPGEEEIVLDAWQRLRAAFPDCRLIIAPRHIERTDSVIRLLQERGFLGIRLSTAGADWPEDAVVVVDQMGKLKQLYRVASVVFVGKTFKAGGGQNMIEPLVFGSPVFTGPLTQNFKDVMEIFLKAGVIVQLEKPEQLADEMIRVLNDAALVERIRVRAPEVIRSHQGATERLMGIVARFLS